MRLEGEKINVVGKGDEVISAEVLATVLDRSPAAFSDETKNEQSQQQSSQSSSVAFQVMQRQVDEGNDALAWQMGETVELEDASDD